MLKKTLAVIVFIIFSLPAAAGPFESPLQANFSFKCEKQPQFEVSYYIHPTTGTKTVVYWETIFIGPSPDDVEYNRLDSRTFRKVCGMGTAEAQFLKGDALRNMRNAPAVGAQPKPNLGLKRMNQQ